MVENEEIEFKNKVVDAKNQKVGIANKKCKNNCKNKTTIVQKLSNHIEFIDYIPTHEVITYRHLFAYGFYVE
ncbi:MAG: hypothetical protein ACI4T1_01515 [Christensenellales bacterium]